MDQPQVTQPQPTPEVVNPAPIAAEPMPFGGYVSNPFRLTLTSLGHTLQTNGIPLVFSALTLAGFVLSFMLLMALSLVLKSTALSIIVGLAGFLAYIYLIISLTMANVQMVLEGINDRQDSFKNFFAYGRSLFFKSVGLYIVMIIAFILPAIILALTFLPVWLTTGLFVIVEVMLIIRLSLAQFALVHDKLGPFAALKSSWSLSSRHGFEIFGALVTGSLFGGGLLSYATAASSLGGRYLQLKSLKASGAAKVKTHWVNYVLGAVPIISIAASIGLSIYLTGLIENAVQNNPTPSTIITPTYTTPSTDYSY